MTIDVQYQCPECGHRTEIENLYKYNGSLTVLCDECNALMEEGEP